MRKKLAFSGIQSEMLTYSGKSAQNTAKFSTCK